MNTNNPPPPVLEWEAVARIVAQRGKRWYVIGGAFVIVCAVWGFLSGNWSFAVTAVLLGGVYYLARNAPAHTHRIRIEHNGFVFDGAFSAWDDCRDFWLVTIPGAIELHIQRKGRRGEAVIRTNGLDPALLRATLGQFLPERSDQRERLVDALIRILKL